MTEILSCPVHLTPQCYLEPTQLKLICPYGVYPASIYICCYHPDEVESPRFEQKWEIPEAIDFSDIRVDMPMSPSGLSITIFALSEENMILAEFHELDTPRLRMESIHLFCSE